MRFSWTSLCCVFLLTLTSIYIVLLVGDFAYSCWVTRQITAWESKQVYDEQGVRDGCQAYNRGEGDDAVLLVHGFNNSPRLWDFIAQELAEQGYHCRAMRLPGFAMTNEQYARSTIEDWIEAVQEEVATLKASHGRVHLVAHSLGAAISLVCETQKPGTFDSMSLVAPLISVSNARSPILTTRQWQWVSRLLLVFTHSTFNPFPPDIKDPNAEDYPWGVPATPRSVSAQTLQLAKQIRPLADEITVPVLMVASRQDLVVDFEASKRFFEEISTEKRWVEAIQSGHLVPLDLDRGEIVERLVGFWGELKSSPSLNQNETRTD